MEVLSPLAMLLLCWCAGLDAQEAPPETTVSSGRLQGKWLQSRDGRSFAAFQGIPYAAPPVGNLRFQEPQSPSPWEGVKQATTLGSQCSQGTSSTNRQLVGEEDCLFINVYTPQVQTATPYDVMVFIFGGSYDFGSGNIYDPEYILDHDVILVTFNYRIGPLGFLSTSDNVIPGNAGLKDQVHALRWVKENIESFGGNSSNVVIFGESAGAASVHFLTLSPLAKGLFHKAIAESATSLSPWAFSRPGEPRQLASRLAEALGCPAEPSAALRDCLLAVEYRDIVHAEYDLFMWNRLSLSLFKPAAEAPEVEGSFLTRDPREVLSSSSGPESDVPFLVGFVSNEGAYWASRLHGNESLLREFDENFDSIVPMMLNIQHLPQQMVQDSVKQMRKFYFGDNSISSDRRGSTINFFTDALFLWPIVRTIGLQQSTRVFFYEFAYLSRSISTFPGTDPAEYGISHQDDLKYLFPMRPNSIYTDEDIGVSRVFVKLFVNFATNGIPTDDGSWWRVQHPEAAEYFRIGSATDLARRSIYEPERMLFWKELPSPIGEAQAPRPPSSASSNLGPVFNVTWMVISSILIVLSSHSWLRIP